MAVKSGAAGDSGVVTQPSLTLKRRLNARPETVYAAWTDPQKIARWFGPGSVKAGTERASIDARVGGRFRWVMQAPNGEIHDARGASACLREQHSKPPYEPCPQAEPRT